MDGSWDWGERASWSHLPAPSIRAHGIAQGEEGRPQQWTHHSFSLSLVVLFGNHGFPVPSKASKVILFYIKRKNVNLYEHSLRLFLFLLLPMIYISGSLWVPDYDISVRYLGTFNLKIYEENVTISNHVQCKSDCFAYD
jgi:hypothetical protein